MEARFKYKMDRRCRRLSVINTVIIILVVAAIAILVSGYIAAWMYSILVAIVGLFILSIPRYIKVDDENLEIHCVVEMTRIEVRDISSIRSVDRSEFRNRMIPVLGSYGFFGYYGYYFNFREWEMLKIYTTERDHLVEIEDIYEQKFLVSCREADKLIEAVMQAKLDRAGEFFDE